MSRLPRWTWYAVAALVVAGLAYALLRPRAIPVETAVTTRGPLTEFVEVEATTRVRDRYVVTAPVNGRLLRLPWHEGDRVRRGQLLARIDPLPANAAVAAAIAQIAELREQQSGVETLKPKAEAIAQAQSGVESARAAYAAAQERAASARATHDQAVRDLARIRQLESKGYVPRAQLESAQLAEASSVRALLAAQQSQRAASAAIDSARSLVAELGAKQSDPEYLRRVYGERIRNVEAQLANLEDQAARTTIRSPLDATILRVAQQSEQYVLAGTTLLELGDRGRLEIVADVLSPDAVRMRPGDAITVMRGAGDRRVRGRVRVVEPSGYTKISALGIEEQRVNVIGDFVDPPGSVGDRYRLDVQITTWKGDGVLRAPLAALYRCGADWCAFAVRDGRARQVRVAIGHRGETEVEVRSGLKAEETLILHPSDRIREGTPVAVARRVEGSD